MYTKSGLRVAWHARSRETHSFLDLAPPRSGKEPKNKEYRIVLKETVFLVVPCQILLEIRNNKNFKFKNFRRSFYSEPMIGQILASDIQICQLFFYKTVSLVFFILNRTRWNTNRLNASVLPKIT